MQLARSPSRKEMKPAKTKNQTTGKPRLMKQCSEPENPETKQKTKVHETNAGGSYPSSGGCWFSGSPVFAALWPFFMRTLVFCPRENSTGSFPKNLSFCCREPDKMTIMLPCMLPCCHNSIANKWPGAWLIHAVAQGHQTCPK